jgi:hypothetical protein
MKMQVQLTPVTVTSNFQLEICFCSCPAEHDVSCPNYGKIEEEPTMEITFAECPEYKLVCKNYKWELIDG